ncbi:hypothetical protein C8A03DRAFT_35658 [Achaetomium macrosporum]|uniref:Uncharacterized protein n=1 Tax=Achaetomium macrosporum TaxID=79813 RepID=A0AAN7C6T9_9PEZI|nr:hypothetical protein C8A03DRAFT_35658 [Achaetomium macrosporum]
MLLPLRKVKRGDSKPDMPSSNKSKKSFDSLAFTAQAVEQIEQELGDIARGADFPMSRTRGGSTSSFTSSANSYHVPPPPTRPPPLPPIPAEYQQRPRVPHYTSAPNGDSRPLPRTRPPLRSRGASAPDGHRQQDGDSLATAGNSHLDSRRQLPGPPAPSLQEAEDTPLARWLRQQEEVWHGEISRHLKQSKNIKPHTGPPPPKPATFSLFPPVSQPRPLTASPSPATRYVTSSSAATSNLSRSSAPGPSQGPPQSLFRDLDPDNPFGYPAPPPFLHNWDTPNRSKAASSRNPSGIHHAGHAGHTGPPVGSRPRPASALPQPSATTKSGHQFPYYPMMSPYEAEAVTRRTGNYESRSQSSNPHYTESGRSQQQQQHEQGYEHGYHQFQTQTQTRTQYQSQSQAQAQMLPNLNNYHNHQNHELLSAEQAAAAMAAATQVRNTVFIDRGVDLGGIELERDFEWRPRISSSSCYSTDANTGGGGGDAAATAAMGEETERQDHDHNDGVDDDDSNRVVIGRNF